MHYRYAIVAAGLGLAAAAVWHSPPHPPVAVAAAPRDLVSPPRDDPSAEPQTSAARAPRCRRSPRARRTRAHSRARAHRRRRRNPGVVALNAASAQALAEIPGIGAAIAERIVELRDREGAYDSLDELLDVAGMNEGRLERARPYLRV